MRIFRALLVTSVTVALVVGVAPVASAKPGDKAIAKKALLTEDDLPGTGWETEPRDKDSEAKGDDIRKEIFECFSVQRVIDRSRKYRVAGPNFNRDASTGRQSVDDTVYVFPDVKTARSYVAPFLADDGIDCFRKALVEILQQAVPGVDVLVQSQERPPELGDSSVGFELIATLTDDSGAKDTVYFDAIAVRVGRAVTGLTFQSANVPYQDKEDLAQAATDKLEQAL